MKYPEIALEKSITQLVHESNLILHTGKKSKMHHCTLFENMFIQLVVRKKLLILNESTKEISRTHVKTVRIKDLDDTNELKNAFNLVITTLSGNEVIFLCSSDGKYNVVNLKLIVARSCREKWLVFLRYKSI